MQNEWMKKILSERKRSFFLRYGRKKLIWDFIALNSN
jgi:hypothetical protein